MFMGLHRFVHNPILLTDCDGHYPVKNLIIKEEVEDSDFKKYLNLHSQVLFFKYI